MPEVSPAERPLRFGANYVPSRGWFYSWLDLDADAVRRDLADLAALGMDHVRIFPIWPWIQPGRGHLRPTAMADVRTVIRLAGEAGLEVSVDLLQGHLSSFDFLPSWMRTWHDGSVFVDARVREGIHSYARALTGEVVQEPNVFAITIGNEVNNLWPANSTTLEESTQWAGELVSVVREVAGGRQVIHSLYDDALYAPDHPFAPGDVTRFGDQTSVHSWVFNGSALDGPTGPATTSHAAYLACLAAACGPVDRPIWLQEVGAPTEQVPVADAEEFVARTVACVTALPTLTGITWWCSHDIDRAQLDFPEREYDLGLVTVDHEIKPLARALRDAVQHARRTTPPAQRAAITAPVDIVAEPKRRAEVAPGSAFHRAWVEAGRQPDGTVIPARIVLPQ
ncbi:glycosyl hydrolase [Flexivirga sp. ID2601S]|uniref:Glycosyl hydrolase n=1 Tax=Flexivirga aerilata TaxID=1656889 RepID=A0A849AII2_9MICO|nr:glycosyl hydrolase [Flexivirga aerilata]NNG39753.1 glycosyl hydrolase [Flexivirga aerilata]